MSNETIQAIERNIKIGRDAIEFGNALIRLRGNKDFKTVILNGYFEREAIRLVHLKADQNMQSADSQRSIVASMDAIGSLNQYFNTVMHKASLADKSVNADQETLEELAAGELTND